MAAGEQINWNEKENAALEELGQAFAVLLESVATKEVISLLTHIVHKQCQMEAETRRQKGLTDAALRNYLETGNMEPEFGDVEKSKRDARIEIVNLMQKWARSLRGLAKDKEAGDWPPDYLAKAG